MVLQIHDLPISCLQIIQLSTAPSIAMDMPATKKHKKLKRGSADFELLCFFVAKNRLTS
jgi:hypothetical protein